MKKWLFAILFGTLLVLGACGGGDDNNADKEPADNNGDTGTEEPSDDGGGTVDTAAAEEVFKSNCASCHGQDLSGNSAPGLQDVGSKFDAGEIADIIENGTDGGMPAGQAKGDDVDLLANWLAEKK